jgi:hypothetical protein
LVYFPRFGILCKKSGNPGVFPERQQWMKTRLAYLQESNRGCCHTYVVFILGDIKEHVIALSNSCIHLSLQQWTVKTNLPQWMYFKCGAWYHVYSSTRKIFDRIFVDLLHLAKIRQQNIRRPTMYIPTYEGLIAYSLELFCYIIYWALRLHYLLGLFYFILC